VSVKVDMKRFGLVNDDDSHNQDKWRSLTTVQHRLSAVMSARFFITPSLPH